MDKVLIKLFKKLSTKLSYIESPQLFNNDLELQLDVSNICVDILKYNGYRVAKRPTFDTIINVHDLVNYFYSLMEYYHGEFCSLTSSKNRDNAIISSFLSHRMLELGYSKKAAISDCAAIMSAIVINEKELGLDRQVGIWVFGTDKCKWITDKAIGFMNTHQCKYNEELMLEKAKEFSDNSADSYTGYDIDEIITRRKLNG